MASTRKILVAVDDSEASISALKYVIADIVQVKNGDQVILLHVVKAPILEKKTGDLPKESDLVKHGVEFIKAKFVPILERGGIKHEVHVEAVRPGVHISTNMMVANAICKFATTYGAKLIVMAKHDSAVKRAVMGSVCKSVAEHSSLPVMMLEGNLNFHTPADIAGHAEKVNSLTLSEA